MRFPDLDMQNPFGDDGPRPPEFFDMREQFEDDPYALGLLREGYRAPRREKFTPEEPPGVKLGGWMVPGQAVDDLVSSLSREAENYRFRPARGFGDAFGQAFARSSVQSLTGPRMRDMERRSTSNREDAARVERANEYDERRVMSARDAASRLAYARGEKSREEKRKAAAVLAVPPWLAKAAGREDLIGQRVSEAEYDRLQEDAGLKERITPKPAKAEKPDPWEGLTAKERWEMEKFDRRESQITARIDRWKQSRADTKDEKATQKAEIARLEADLDKLYADRDAKLGGSGGSPAGGPGTAASAPSAAPAGSSIEVPTNAKDARERWANRPPNKGQVDKAFLDAFAQDPRRRAAAAQTLGKGGPAAVPTAPKMMGSRQGAAAPAGAPAAMAPRQVSGPAGDMVGRMQGAGIRTRESAAKYVAKNRAWMKENGVSEAEVLGAFQ